MSTTLLDVGHNATLISQDFEGAVRALKERLDGDIEVGGTILARSLAELDLIDEYQIYVHPVVLGAGTPFFQGVKPAVRLVASERIGDQSVRLTLVPERS